MKTTVYDGVLGLCVGDALGVPVEFESRESLKADPVEGMRGFGTYNQPAGTWSDDTSMVLCTVDSLAAGLNPYDLMTKFSEWMLEGKYTPHGETFDVGMSTRMAIEHFYSNRDEASCGLQDEGSNGNGSLMRILPLVYPLVKDYGYGLALHDEAMATIHEFSGLTHGHKRSQMACGIFLAVAGRLLEGSDKEMAVAKGLKEAKDYYLEHTAFKEDFHCYNRIFEKGFACLPEDAIKSSGYVVHSLEAALWAFMSTDNYRNAVLKAVNLGHDTDTSAAITGGLAGIAYGAATIPDEWVAAIHRLGYIRELCEALQIHLDKDL